MKNIQKIKDYWWLLTTIGGILIAFIGGIWALALKYNEICNKNNEILDTIKTTQQMALKSVIWNDNIPLPERASACDVYLSAGYNSLTKKECQVIIDKGSEQGLF